MRTFNKKRLQVFLALLIILILSTALWFLSSTIVIILLWLFFFPVAISLISGIIKGILYGTWDTFWFAIKIFLGNFIYEKNLNFPSGTLTIISRLVWEQPQTFIGNFGMHLMNSVWLVKRIDIYKRALICQGYFLNGGGIALGSFIMIDLNKSAVVNIFPMDDRVIPEKILIRHEYGHLLQSLASGPLYIFKYGISSVIMQGWTEADADLRSDHELLITEQIMPVFSSHRKLKQPLNPRWWEFLIIPLLVFASSQINGFSGVIGGILISTMLISLLNLKKPV